MSTYMAISCTLGLRSEDFTNLPMVVISMLVIWSFLVRNEYLYGYTLYVRSEDFTNLPMADISMLVIWAFLVNRGNYYEAVN